MSDGPKTEIILRRRRVGGEELVGTLGVLEGPGVGRFFVLERDHPFTIGRAEDCEASFPHWSVSRRHATLDIAYKDDRLRARLRDLGSTNGVRLNGKPGAEHLLVSGDKLKLGRVLLRFEWMSAEEVAYHRRLAEDHQVAIRDSLSGLLTRAFLDDRLPKLLDGADQDGRPTSCILLDLDHFKAINDAYGHLVGDAVIQNVAVIVQGGLRRRDFPIRYGGDEVLCILPDTTVSVATEIAERLRVAVESKAGITAAHGIAVTASLGVGERKPGEVVLDWIGRSDEALFGAKRGGRNRVVQALDAYTGLFDAEAFSPTERAQDVTADEMLPFGDENACGSQDAGDSDTT